MELKTRNLYMDASEVRDELDSLLPLPETSKETTVVYIRDRRWRQRFSGVLLSYNYFESLLEEITNLLDDLRDLSDPELREALEETRNLQKARERGDVVPWEQVKAELGLDDATVRDRVSPPDQ